MKSGVYFEAVRAYSVSRSPGGRLGGVGGEQAGLPDLSLRGEELSPGLWTVSPLGMMGGILIQP